MIIRLINMTDNKLGELDIDGILYDIDYRIKHISFEVGHDCQLNSI